jgi:CubicO group peptidase (beta-lactamase class C family)
VARPLIRAALAALALSAANAPLLAAPAATTTVAPAELAGFVDGIVAEQIAAREVAGAVVTIVQNGRVVLNRGYGHQDVAAGVPVDATRSLFRPGSVSKLITWTALMQQIERGRVDLDADVNRYLDFTIPPFEGKPIRVRDLFTHSVGMSDAPGIITRDPAKLLTFRDWMKRNIPRRVWAPGTEIAYSNYGAALAGYIVAQVSGEDFDTYVERQLLGPLKMDSTSFREPLPPALVPRMTKGYRLENGRFVEQPPELISAIAPAGSGTSNGPDMARFIRMLLGGGTLDGRQVLKPESVRFLLSDGLSNAPGLPGMAHGFFVFRQQGPRLVGHGGNTADFHSILVLAPQSNAGFFISMTGGVGSYGARTELADLLVARLFPDTPMAGQPRPADEPQPVGAFRANRRNYDAPVRPEYDATVAVAGPNALTVTMEGKASHWERVGPLLYERVTATGRTGPFERLQFVSGGAGWRLVFGTQPHMAWHRVTP